MILFLYNALIIPVLRIVVRCALFINPKLREREESWKTTITCIPSHPENYRRIWFHVASMGEFEQAKPIIELLKKDNPELSIIVSFFSPSGYRNQKNYPLADAVVYMPFDTRKKARQFIEAINPDVVVFIRYELWLNHLAELSQWKIPVYLFCATFPNSSIWNYPVFRSALHRILNYFTEIYTVSQRETNLFLSINTTTPIISSVDTRFDRIISVIENSQKESPILPDNYFKPDDIVLVAGSTWQPDEEILIKAFHSLEQQGHSIRSIIVPHEPTPEHTQALKNNLRDSVLLSEINGKNSDARHTIVDSIGKLLKLYSYADIVYVGGGFGAGVHSTAEPAGYGVPLVSGRNISRSPDAQNLVTLEALTCINSSNELTEWLLKMVNDESERLKRGELSRQYVYKGLGGSKTAAEIIANYLKS
ncbi:MAG: hypothetical protein HYZ54_13465 [Ignavibacteriae bacterium]|nr:hypothetical protein [Ignavibacteriota bacterium]